MPMEKPDTPKIADINCLNCGAAVVVNSLACDYCGSPLYTRICTACFCAVSCRMNHCPKCGAAVVETQRAPQKDLKCPICTIALEIHENGNHPFYVCTQCGGMWADHDSFQFICDRAEILALEQGYKLPDLYAADAGKPRRTYIPCPECGVIMTPKNFAGCSGIIIDNCRKHGNWFDWQELHQVVEFIRKGGMSKSRGLEMKRALEHARNDRSNWGMGSAMKRFLSDPNIRPPKDS